jgi:hypothetical protein
MPGILRANISARIVSAAPSGVSNMSVAAWRLSVCFALQSIILQIGARNTWYPFVIRFSRDGISIWRHVRVITAIIQRNSVYACPTLNVEVSLTRVCLGVCVQGSVPACLVRAHLH